MTIPFAKGFSGKAGVPDDSYMRNARIEGTIGILATGLGLLIMYKSTSKPAKIVSGLVTVGGLCSVVKSSIEAIDYRKSNARWNEHIENREERYR